jgi:hypothetical protein
MTSYVVVKDGVYIQEVYGPFDALGQATDKCEKLAKEDEDDYHLWLVCELNSETGLGGTLFSCRKAK